MLVGASGTFCGGGAGGEGGASGSAGTGGSDDTGGAGGSSKPEKPDAQADAPIGAGGAGPAGGKGGGGTTGGPDGAANGGRGGTGGPSGGSGGDSGPGKVDGSQPVDAKEPDPTNQLSCTPMGPVPALKGTRIAEGLIDPTEIVGPPGLGNTVWIVEHRLAKANTSMGRVRVVKDGTLLDAPLVTVSVMARGNDEEGVQSIALDPAFQTSKKFYLFYSSSDASKTTVEEFVLTSETAAKSNGIVYQRPSSHQYHNGGKLDFGPDGKLYISVGDNNADCGPPCAQMAEGDFGRILRLDFATKTGKTLHNGLRNPYRFSFDRQTGDLYIGDVGNTGATAEKLLFAKAGATGLNFGWGKGSGDDRGGFNNYLDQGEAKTPIIGGFVYRGKKMPGLCGRYFYAFHGGAIKSLVVDANGKATDKQTHNLPNGKIGGWGLDAEGEMYYADYAGGTVYKIEPAQ